MERTAVVVEDQDDIRSLLTAILESSGFIVHGADNGLDGVELIRSVSPDVTTLDVNIPGIDGFEVARRVRAFSDTYIIFISAFVEPGDAERGRAAGGDEYLGKPFRPRDLKARLASIPTNRRREAAGAGDPLTAAATASELAFGDLSIVDDGVHVGDAVVAPAPVELAILRQLIGARGRVRTKDELAVALRPRTRDETPDADEVRVVERAVEGLRRTLEGASSTTRIESQHGLGYRLVAA